jgi:phosphatidylinositol glycan class B
MARPTPQPAAPSPWFPQGPVPRAVLFGSLLLGMLLRAKTALGDDGINWPDELYQSFEPAHRLVFGYGLVAWEFLEGARTWAVPGFVAGWLWLCKLVGAGAPSTYIPVVKLVFSLLSVGAAWGVYRLARVFGARDLEASISAATWSLCALALYFSPRAMSENLATAPLVWGLALVFDPDAGRRRRVTGASLLGLATLARLQVGVACAVVVLVLALQLKQRGAQPLVEVLGTLVAWALVYGLWDAAAWHDLPGAKAGGLFHSAVVYYRFNIVENRGAGWGTAPWSYFFQHLFASMPLLSLAFGAAALASLRRAWSVALVVAVFVALHLFVAHKELRFLLPVLPLACALLGVALSLLPEQPARLGVVGLGAVVALSALGASKLTMGDVGSYPERAASSAWDDFGPVNRLLLAASKQPDVCGLRIDAAHLAWTGGSTYLHHAAPLYMPGFPAQHGFFNYAITGGGSGAQVIAREGPWELVRLRPTCVPDTNYSWRLP